MTSYRNFWLSLLNIYHLLLGIYWILRSLFGGTFWWLALLNTFALFVIIPLLLTVPVTLLLRGKRSTAIAIILTVIAIAKYVPLPKPAPPPSNDTIRVISYNVWNRNPQLNSDIDWLLEQDADVIVLVEAVNHHLPVLSRLMNHYAYQYTLVGGIMIVSRYPILENQIVVLEVADSENKGRVALRSQLDVNGQAISVYSVHLSVPRSPAQHFPFVPYQRFIYTIQHYDESRRNAQIAVLLEYVGKENNPVLIMGDFNMSHTSAIYDDFVAAGLVDSYAAAGNGFGLSWSLKPSLPPVLRIDYVWHSSSLRTVQAQIGERRGSDHLPVIVDIALD
ncbi:MAG: endonuclease/exonuclease/phosphatase family protein [Anaerolineae bacterium]|nr:endonuclease/exonuclease/phosphatase family protein [Anaerolineae bacterium]MDQ7033500.1 endonuclease/exonuclease/phosphatase family protein [Anaerolineae bacterium]